MSIIREDTITINQKQSTRISKQATAIGYNKGASVASNNIKETLLDKDALTFIEKNIDLIDANDFDSIYLDSTFIGLLARELLRPRVTQKLLSCDINPLKYMSYLPDYYSDDRFIEEFTIPSNIKSISTYSLSRLYGLKKLIIENFHQSLYIENNMLSLHPYNCGEITLQIKSPQFKKSKLKALIKKIDFNEVVMLNVYFINNNGNEDHFQLNRRK